MEGSSMVCRVLFLCFALLSSVVPAFSAARTQPVVLQLTGMR